MNTNREGSCFCLLIAFAFESGIRSIKTKIEINGEELYRFEKIWNDTIQMYQNVV